MIIPFSLYIPSVDFWALNLITSILFRTDLIQKLISKGKQLDAVNFAYAFEIVDKFPPVPLLKAYLKEAKKIAQEVRRKGNNSTQSLVCNLYPNQKMF